MTILLCVRERISRRFRENWRTDRQTNKQTDKPTKQKTIHRRLGLATITNMTDYPIVAKGAYNNNPSCHSLFPHTDLS